MQISKLKNHELESQLSKLFALERKTTASILECLVEVFKRRLYLEYGYTSFFAFLVGHYHQPPPTAQRWLDCARIGQTAPEIQNDFATGRLNPSQVALLASCLRQKEKEVTSTQDTVKPAPLSKTIELLDQIRDLTLADTQIQLAQSLDLKIKITEKKVFQQDQSLRIEITLSAEQQRDLEEAKQLLSHKYPNLSYAELFSVLAKELIHQKSPLRQKKKASVKKQCATTSESEVSPTSSESGLDFQLIKEEESTLASSATVEDHESTADLKSATDLRSVKDSAKATGADKTKVPTIGVPVAIRRHVFVRDRVCQQRTQKGICGSRFQLQVDHIQSRWAGGSNELQNLQLLCSVHNQEKYRREALLRRR